MKRTSKTISLPSVVKNNLKCKSPITFVRRVILFFDANAEPNEQRHVNKRRSIREQEESKSKPFKVVVNLEYTEKQFKEVLERFQ